MAGETGARPARGARRAPCHGRPRGTAAAGRGRGGRRGRPDPGRVGRSARRGRQSRAGGRSLARRVDPHRRVTGRGEVRRRRGALRVVRRGGVGTVHRDGRREGELRGEGGGRRAYLPPPALSARAVAQPAPAHHGRHHGAARRHLRLRALRAGEVGEGDGHDGGRGNRHAHPRRPDPAGERHVRSRSAADGATWRPRPAAERDRVAGLGRDRLPRQDGDAHRGLAPRRPRDSRAGCGRAVPGRRARSLRGKLAERQRDARRSRRGVPRQGRGRAWAYPLLVEAALERRTRRCRRLRARCPGALRARPARRGGGGRAAERPPRRRAGDDRCLLRAVRRGRIPGPAAAG